MLEERPAIFGNDAAFTVQWAGETALASCAGTPVRLYMELKDADLFAIRFLGQ